MRLRLLSFGLAVMYGDEVFLFGEREDAGFRNEPHTERNFERKAGSAAFDDVDGEFGMLPVFKLIFRHIKIAAGDLTHPHIRIADHEFTFRVAHRRTPVAATAGLVKHKLTVGLSERFHDLFRFGRNFHTRHFVHILNIIPKQAADLLRMLPLHQPRTHPSR